MKCASAEQNAVFPGFIGCEDTPDHSGFKCKEQKDGGSKRKQS